MVIPIKLSFYTTLALLAFAGNSVLCRLALGDESIDAASFTSIRLLSGIATLILIVVVSRKDNQTATLLKTSGSWLASLMLFIYAAAFSFAYISLDTATGALILFASVQFTMIFISLISGNRPHSLEWLGILIAFAGFFYLVAPNINTPSFDSFILMVLAGIAWGAYTLIGRGSRTPLHDTTSNFLRTLPFVLVLILFSLSNFHLSQQGILLAILSGAIASGIGYAIWYRALRELSVTLAAVLQLLVPIIAGIGGLIFAQEAITIRLVIASILVLGGILIVLRGRHTAKNT